MAPFEALYGHKCHTQLCWSELSKMIVVGPDLVWEAEDKFKLILEWLNAAFDQQKSYANLKRREIEYVVGDLVFLKVSSWKKMLRFGCKGKLSPRFIGSYEVLECVGLVAYQLRLPHELECIHDVFHISMLRRYWSNPSHVILKVEVEVHTDLYYEEEPIKILASDVKVFRIKSVSLVKVLWCNHNAEEATWESEELMR
ncbi:uncharacterized protein LOC120158800 [Hibiscus syriacus]|uniref:uncharacterized protein LOC120158800 n=1 Tax=Hibiscus syriacus TaxID=106335 RepID=UPI0019244E34|nr:uncharacterized protein LOC120158800 [Hibiscus syriacus]